MHVVCGGVDAASMGQSLVDFHASPHPEGVAGADASRAVASDHYHLLAH